MANPLRGEVALPGTAYVLRFTTNTICVAEAEADASFAELVTGLDEAGDKVRVSDLRRWLRWGLMHAHPEMTDEQAGEIADEAGGLRHLSLTLSAALRAAIGTEGDATTKKATSRRRTG